MVARAILKPPMLFCVSHSYNAPHTKHVNVEREPASSIESRLDAKLQKQLSPIRPMTLYSLGYQYRVY